MTLKPEEYLELAANTRSDMRRNLSLPVRVVCRDRSCAAAAVGARRAGRAGSKKPPINGRLFYAVLTRQVHNA